MRHPCCDPPHMQPRPAGTPRATGVPPESRRARKALFWAACALLLAGFNLRLIFPSLSVLLPEIMRSTGMTSATAGYLTTVPVLCMGLFAPLAPRCVRRFGIERTMVVALLLLALGTALRSVHGVAGLFAGSLLAGSCIAVVNVLAPVLVKRDFPTHVALMTGLYVTVMNFGSAGSAALTIPLIRAWETGWATGLAIWAVPAAAAGLLWLTRNRVAPPPTHAKNAAPRVWRDPLAWQVTIYMGLQSALAYAVLGWLAPILLSRGLRTETAGLATSVCIITTLIGALLTPLLLRRTANQQLLAVVLALGTGLPLAGFIFAPTSWVWILAALQGLGQGAMFATALTLIVLRSRDTPTATQLSSMSQAAGYVIAASTPLLIGLIQSWTGSFNATAWLFVAVTLAASLAGWLAGRNRYVSPLRGTEPQSTSAE